MSLLYANQPMRRSQPSHPLCQALTLPGHWPPASAAARARHQARGSLWAQGLLELFQPASPMAGLPGLTHAFF